MIDVIMILITCVLIYLTGRIHGQRWMWRCMTQQDRLAARIDPPRRTIGMPTNADAEPSDVRRARWRNGSFSRGRDQKEW